MSFIKLASNNSVWRGLDYYKDHRVTSWRKIGDGEYDGTVFGSEGKNYTVHIDKMHPRKSKCNCPHADGKRVICKHMIALFFTMEPGAEEDFLKQAQKREEEAEKREQQHYIDMRRYVNSLSKSELREELLEAILELEDIRGYYR